MTLHYHRLGWPGRAPGLTGEALHLAHGSARGSRIELPRGWWSLWIPIGSPLQCEAEGHAWTLDPGQALIARGAMTCSALGRGPWLVLTGSPGAWSRIQRPGMSPSPGLLPRQWPCPRLLRRRMLQLARAARDGRPPDIALHAIGATLHEQQRELAPLLARCSGRTPQRRHLTLQRLLRVHHRIERQPGGRLELAELAAVASYSPWHLIRMYRDVFGETPSEHVARLRLARAWTLVRTSTRTVCDISDALGFESESAFCRAFKNAYGLTTTQARQLPAGRRTCVDASRRRPFADSSPARVAGGRSGC